MAFRFKHFSVEHQNSSMKVGTDAVLLAATANVEKAMHILDVGTGCGVIALACAQKSSAIIQAIDIHEPSVKEANRNFKNSRWSNRLNARHASFQHLAEVTFDLIISNPPFFQQSLASPELSRHNARHNVHLSFRDFALAANRILKADGTVWVILPLQESLFLTKEMLRYGFAVNYTMNVFPKEEKDANRRIMQFKRAKEVHFTTTQNLTIRNADNNYTESYKKLTADFYLGF